jgi:hypothetical protein
MEISEAQIEEIKTKLAEARQLEAQAAALDELSRVFPKDGKDMNPFVILPRLLDMHESGVLAVAVGEQSARGMIASTKKACADLKAGKRRRLKLLIFAVLTVVIVIWSLT